MVFWIKHLVPKTLKQMANKYQDHLVVSELSYPKQQCHHLRWTTCSKLLKKRKNRKEPMRRPVKSKLPSRWHRSLRVLSVANWFFSMDITERRRLTFFSPLARILKMSRKLLISSCFQMVKFINQVLKPVKMESHQVIWSRNCTLRIIMLEYSTKRISTSLTRKVPESTSLFRRVKKVVPCLRETATR